MITLSNYTIADKLHDGVDTVVYRGYRNADHAAVTIKLFKSDYPTSQQSARLRHQFTITRELDLSSVVKVYDLEETDGNLALVAEEVDARSLKDILRTEALSLTTCLRIADSLADAIGSIHARHVIHKDIKPQNILVSLETCQVKIIDFGIATRLSQEPQEAKRLDLLEGTLAYMSPEQTGRMNRALDHRTDLYSTGVTLYEMLTGVLPFRATDPMELVHSHIARMPAPPRELVTSLPEAVSNIVMKLLEKAAEDRYQSAYGLRADLRECLVQLAATGSIAPFPLRRYDRGHGLLLPQRLYGRESHAATLLAAFERATHREAAFVAILGAAGVGKSSLVNELYKATSGRRAHFIAGKFDKLDRSIPYTALGRAFGQLVRQLCGERREALHAVRHKILAAVGERGQVLIDLIPELAFILDRQPGVPELGPVESQIRFNMVFQSFLRVFTDAEEPLVLFLDDLQWADLASLKLLTQILTSPEPGRLLVIGAYRDDEVDASHPIRAAETRIQSAGIEIIEVGLVPLLLPDVTHLIADALDTDKEGVAPLSRLVFEKTQGNPFFVNQFLLSLYKDRWLSFDTSRGAFAWDIERIKSAAITDNVVDFMAKKLKQLSPSTQRVIELAACIGHTFDLRTLSALHRRSRGQTAADLWEALQENVVLPLDAGYRFLPEADGEDREAAPDSRDIEVSYRFLHDRVQEAAYSLIDEGKKQDIHLQIGRMMLAQGSLGGRDERMFQVINHMNLGAGRITELSERLSLARLNLTAGRRAKASSSYDLAAGYLKAGAELLGEEGFQCAYELSFALGVERAECEHLGGRWEEADALFDAALCRAKTGAARTRVRALCVQLASSSGRSAQSVSVARTALAELGIELPETQERIDAALAAELRELPENLAGRGAEELLHAGELTDPEKQVALTILMNVSRSLLWKSPALVPLNTLQQLNISLKHGHGDASAFGYITYGMMLCAEGKYSEGYGFGKLALDLSEKRGHRGQSCKVKATFVAFISPYRAPLRASFKLLEEAHRAGLDAGELQYACVACTQTIFCQIIQGVALDKVEEYIDALTPVFQRSRPETFVLVTASSRLMIKSLRGRTEDGRALHDDARSEALFEERFRVDDDEVGMFWHWLLRAELSFLKGDHEHALSMIERAEHGFAAMPRLWIKTEISFYKSLIMLSLYPKAEAADKARYALEIERHKGKLAVLAGSCPANFFHKHLLVSAESARVEGDDLRAMDLYDEAIRSARESGFLQNEALSNELSARFYLAKGRLKIARVYVTDAISGYARWGAEAKVEALKEGFAELLPRGGAKLAEVAAPTQTTSRRGLGEALDLATVIKASHAISRVMELDKLLEALMRTAMENAGANKGRLILADKDDLAVEAAADEKEPRISILRSIPLDEVEDLSHAVVRYVQKTKERVVIESAAEDSLFRGDAYIERTEAKSILCAPILRQGELVGVFYLENTLIEGAFTPSRLKILELLSAQAAISIENSRLYATLEERVRERTAELQEVQARLISMERAATEQRMAGGFAHEIRNALAGARLVLARLLGEDAGCEGGLMLDSASEISRLHAALTERLSPSDPEPLLSQLQHLFENQRSTDKGLQLVSRAVNRALVITKKIMDFSRIADSRGAPEEVSLREVIDSVLADLGEKISSSGISIRTDMAGSLRLFSDETQCYSIVQNLLNNALDAILEGDLDGSEGCLELKAWTAERACIIQVTDNGVGIPEENIDKIFDSFYSTKPDTGTGLGLAVVKKIVDLNGGTIKVESERGKGSKFTVTLPTGGSFEEERGAHDGPI